MSRSEIFENYAKIALESGLIKTADKKTKEIENLYNVKNEKPSDMEYKKNIVEMAHPEPVVLFQSHDKINSLIENVNERQNIMVNILQKTPNGNLTQKKYAEELTLSLIRVATDMDNQNKDELRILADTCAEQLQKKAFDLKDFMSEKGGDVVDVGGGVGTGAAIGAIAGGLLGVFGGPLAPATITAGITGGAVAGAAIAGVLSSIFKTSPQAKSLVLNAEIARKELGDLIKDFPDDVSMHELDSALLHITSTASDYSRMVDKMHAPSASAGDKSNVQKIATEYLQEIAKLNILIGRFLSNAKTGKYAPKESDWWSKVKSPFTAILGDDVADEVKALETLGRVIKETQDGINLAIRETQNLATEASEATPVSMPDSKSPSHSASSPKENETDYFKQFGDLDKMFSELGK